MGRLFRGKGRSASIDTSPPPPPPTLVGTCLVRAHDGTALVTISEDAMRLLFSDLRKASTDASDARSRLLGLLSGPSCYAIYNQSDNTVKIGMSVNAVARRNALATGTSGVLHLMMVWHSNDPAYLERYLHLHLQEHRVNREWFHAPGALDALRSIPYPVYPDDGQAKLMYELRSQRATTGLAAAKARGVRVGRPYSLSPTAVDQARALVAAGHRVGDVAKSLGVGRSTLYRVLESVG